MISRLFKASLIVSFVAFMPASLLANEAQSVRIGNAYYQYCIQESLANDAYCTCISETYTENLADMDFSPEEEKFIITALSGLLVYSSMSDDDISMTENLMQKLNSPTLEEGFLACASLNEEIFIEEPESNVESPLTDEQIRAIEELDAIEEMEEMDDL